MNNQARARCVALLSAIALTLTFQLPVGAQEEPRDRDRDAGPENERLRVETKMVPPGEIIDYGRWRLGVTGEPLDVGFRIRDVLPRSPASRAGLETHDIIVAVGGYQIGLVNGRLYPLEDELQRRASPEGRVRLLVQDRRSSRLVNVDVVLELARADEHHGLIRGIAEYRERMSLPPNAELRVMLQRRTFRGLETIAEDVFYGVSGPPIPFELSYPLNSVYPREDYYLSAEIVSGNQRIFVTERPEVLRLDRPPAEVRLLLRREGYRVN